MILIRERIAYYVSSLKSKDKTYLGNISSNPSRAKLNNLVLALGMTKSRLEVIVLLLLGGI